ncbi:hypothetical protein [Gottfriedia luciferensis]|uniref:hypothetical protein n=1 Tax=Gottfriedia luciferensis TaxID=178774 RepID=UPI0004019DE3|nr:hypothetical protein [Gottfriedia luciferensis]
MKETRQYCSELPFEDHFKKESLGHNIWIDVTISDFDRDEWSTPNKIRTILETMAA